MASGLRTLGLLVLLSGTWSVFAEDVSMSELQEELRMLRKTTTVLVQTNARLTATVETLQARVAQIEKPRAQRQLNINTDMEIGFTATVTADEHNLHVDQSVIYDHVITNIGNAYDSKTGLFHVPVSGTYLFNFNIMAAESNYVEASLVVNGNRVIHALSDHVGTTTSWDMGTTNLVIRVNEGDIVSVAIIWPLGENTVHGNKYNTFSGYLLKAL